MLDVLTHSRRYLLLLVLPLVLAACGPEAADGTTSPTEGSDEGLSVGRSCHADGECPHSNLCRLCDDGSTACASAACIHGRCVAHAAECPAPGPKVFCGGIAGIPCPGGGQCTDDPSDSCDPTKGGADCGGQCVCGPERELCKVGYHWDSSPTACACVPTAVVGVPCGDKACADGEYCCNASCGICAPRGAACIQIACLPKE